MPNKILIPIDFSAFSLAALEYGRVLATTLEARLYLFHAVCFPQNMIFGTAESPRGPEQDRIVRRAREKMEELMEGVRIDWRPLVGSGDPVEAVHHAVRELDVDLILAASHGMGGLRRMVSGTVVEQLVRNADRPVLVIHTSKSSKRNPASHSEDNPFSGKFTGFKRIVVGCDFKEGCSEMVGYARRLARILGAECHLVHFLESPVDENLMDTAQAAYGEMQDMLHQKRRRQLTLVSADSNREGTEVKTAVLPSIPWEGLVAYAGNRLSDLMVVGLRVHGPLERLLTGSTTEAVIRRGVCPVMVIPHGPRNR